MEISEITSEQAQRLLNQKLTSKELDWDTVRNIRIVSSSVMSLAVQCGYLDRNPVRSTTLPPEPERFSTPLPDEAGLYRLIQHLGLRDSTITRLLAKTGLRIGELRARRWRRINLEKRTLEVASSIFRGPIAPDASSATPLERHGDGRGRGAHAGDASGWVIRASTPPNGIWRRAEARRHAGSRGCLGTAATGSAHARTGWKIG